MKSFYYICAMSVVMISTLGTLLYPGSLYSQRRPPLTFRAEESGASVRLERIGNPPEVRLQVSLDGDTWSDYAVNTSIALANIGDSVLIRAKGTNSTLSIGYDKTSRASYYHFSVVGRVSSRGDVMSLLAEDGERMDVPKMCFWRLFYNCSTLTSAPDVSATRLSYGCYMEMFKGCTSLTSAQPVLPALELAGSCYESMYEGCTSMMRSPVLPAEIPDYRSYRRMFCGCSRLREVEVGMREWNVNNFSETDWLRGVSREGVFKCPMDLCVVKPSSRKEGMVRVETVPSSWTLSYTDDTTNLCFTSEESNATLCLNRVGNPNGVSLEYFTTATGFWQDYGIGTMVMLPNIGDRVYFRSKDKNGTFSKTTSDYYQFAIVGRVGARGNIMSLLDKSGEQVWVPAYAFCNLFRGCKTLTGSPKLPAVVLSNACYRAMYYGCSSLSEAPALPAETLSVSCYSYMFVGCTSLREAPALRSERLATSCYTYMFSGCTGLLSVPALPAEKLSATCYTGMFSGCTGLRRGVIIKAETLVNKCCSLMFSGCKNLNRVEVSFRDWNESVNATSDWLKGVAKEGKFVCPDELDTTIRDASHFPVRWNATASMEIAKEELCFTAEGYNSGVALHAVGSPDTVRLEYFTTAAGFWQDYGIGTTVMLPNIGDRVYFRAKDWNATFSKSTSDYYQFTIGGWVGASGNIMSLLDINCQQKSVPDYAFIYLFRGCRSLTQSPELPATELSPYCYCAMFNNCVNLLSPPSLPAREVKMSSYASMFYWCKSLTRAPELPARIVAPYCYSAMFYGCSEMVSSMEELPAEKLAYSCYEDMFTLCSKMESMPRIKATELASNCCWGMFSSCSNLVHVTPLLAKDLAGACYGTMFVNCLKMTSAPVMYAERIGKNSCYQMFRGCSSLRVTPTLQAKSLGKSGYQEMFRECTSLEDASNVRISTTDSNCCADMFTKCTRLTKTPLLGALDLSERCYVGMFSKCRSLKVAPALPAHILAKDCYGAMFADCVGLEEAPALPADTLAENCYSDMFRSCTSLTVAPDLKASTLAIGCYSAMFKGCTNLVQDKSSFKRGDGPDSCYIRVYAKAGLAPMYSYREMFSGCSKLKRLVVDMGRWSVHSSDNWLKGTAVGDTGEFIGPLSSLYDMENYPYISAYYTDDSHLPANWRGWLLNQAYANDTTATFKNLQSEQRKYYNKKPAGVEIIENEEEDWLISNAEEDGDMKPVEKKMEGGRVYIMRGGIRYSLMGQRVYAIKDEE